MQGTNRFADVRLLEKREVVSANTRRFDGDGTAFLVITGAVLLNLTAVTVGQTEIPLVEPRRYVEDATGRETDTVHEDIVTLQTTADGRQVLLRSVLSNHGIWQKGQPVYVTGDWGEEGESLPVPAPEAEPNANTGEPTANTDEDPSQSKTEDKSLVEGSESLEALPDNLKEALKGFDSFEAALNATNEQFNAVGIRGNDITRVRAALQKAIREITQ